MSSRPPTPPWQVAEAIGVHPLTFINWEIKATIAAAVCLVAMRDKLGR